MANTKPNAKQLVYTAPGTGAVERDQYSKNSEVISVKDYGALGTFNIVTATGPDDYPAFAAAITAATDGCVIRVPKGSYRITQELVTTKTISWEGESAEGSLIYFDDCNAIDYQLTAQEEEFTVYIKNLALMAISKGTRRCIKLAGPVSTGSSPCRILVEDCILNGADAEFKGKAPGKWPGETLGAVHEWQTVIDIDQAEGATFNRIWTKGKEKAFLNGFDTNTVMMKVNNVTHINLNDFRAQRYKKGVVLTGQSEGLTIAAGSALVAMDVCVEGIGLVNPSNNHNFTDSHFASHTVGIDIQAPSGSTYGVRAVTIRNCFFIKRDDSNDGGSSNYRAIRVISDGGHICDNFFFSGGTIGSATKQDAAIEIGGRSNRVLNNVFFNQGIGILDAGLNTLAIGNHSDKFSELCVCVVSTGTNFIGSNNTCSEPSASVVSGTAQGGTTGTITLAAASSTISNYYKGMQLAITGGTGAGQVREIVSYDGTTKVVSVGTKTFAVTPDATSTYDILYLNPEGVSINRAASHEFYTSGGLSLRVSNGDTTVDNYVDAVGKSASNGYAWIRGSSKSNAAVDLLLSGSNGGRIRFGTLTASSDVPITGYITIKDAAGTVRKLAVVT
jgi:hypothetical protein